jgi:serine O-acetyltransferase
VNERYRNPIVLYYLANWLYRHRVPLVPRVLQGCLFLLCNAVVPCQANLGKGCQLGHGGSGVVIHPKATLGENVMIAQQVTIVGRSTQQSVPTIGSDVYIGAGAKVLGPITVGDGCVIGANAVVIKSVPPRCVVAGVPARVIRSNVNAHEVETW